MTVLLSMELVAAGYGDAEVLREVSLSVREGSITALLGANGAGKTTVMRVLAGMLPPRNGIVRFAGNDVAGVAAWDRVAAGLALVPEGRQVFADFTVEENLRIGGCRRPAAKRTARLDEIYALFPRLLERRRQLAGSLSGGEQQMLALGRGLMSEPRLLLLDEPTLGLAPAMAAAVFDLIRRIREAGTTILIAEQDVRTTLQTADHAFVIENGRNVLAGPAAALLDDAAVRESYLGM